PQIGRALEADGERVQPRPPGLLLVARLHALRGVADRDGRDDRAVDPARDEHAVRDVAHELPVDSRLERLAQLGRLERLRWARLFGRPARRVVALEPLLRLVTEVEVAGRELLDPLADADQRLHLRGDVEPLLAIPADVERDHADRIARDEE